MKNFDSGNPEPYFATAKIDLWLIRETDKARCFFSDFYGKTIWIPKRVTYGMRPLPDDDPSPHPTWVKCVVDVERWFLEENDIF